jgi:hypothetical protein
MPLSDHEQRILADIEARLRADDPTFAESVQSRTVASDGRRQLRWVVVAFVIGFILLFVGLNVHLLWGVLGFGLMLGAAYQGVMIAKKMTGARAPHNAAGPGGPLQRYLDAARRRTDEDR